MDPFVVTSLGRKTLRTPVIRHNLNPIYNEKMVFQVMKYEQSFTISFTVMDRDKFSGNDFVASASFPLQTLIQSAPVADPETGLYNFANSSASPELPPSKSNVRMGMTRSTSSNSVSKLPRPALEGKRSSPSLTTPPPELPALVTPSSGSEKESTLLDVPPSSDTSSCSTAVPAAPVAPVESDDLKVYIIPLSLKNKERWEDKHFPELHVKAKYVPYRALRQHFWRLMLKQYDADDSGRIDKIEMITMLDTLGSTLKESTIDGFFKRFGAENESSDTMDLTFDQAVMCLEDTLQTLQKNAGNMQAAMSAGSEDQSSSSDDLNAETSYSFPSNSQSQETAVPTLSSEEQPSTTGEYLHPDDLNDERGEEHVVEIRECPLCHQPRLAKRSDADIITHIATCASRDWRQVDNLVMGGFVTSSQAQRKWYTKVVTKISYGGYRLGANSANILVQDRVTGQINEERMSVYVRLGIRLLYKGIKSRDMEKKRSKLHFNPFCVRM